MVFFTNPFAMDDSLFWPGASTTNWFNSGFDDGIYRPVYEPMWLGDDGYRQPCTRAARGRNTGGWRDVPADPSSFSDDDDDDDDDDGQDYNDGAGTYDMRTRRGGSVPAQTFLQNNGRPCDNIQPYQRQGQRVMGPGQRVMGPGQGVQSCNQGVQGSPAPHYSQNHRQPGGYARVPRDDCQTDFPSRQGNTVNQPKWRGNQKRQTNNQRRHVSGSSLPASTPPLGLPVSAPPLGLPVSTPPNDHRIDQPVTHGGPRQSRDVTSTNQRRHGAGYVEQEFGGLGGEDSGVSSVDVRAERPVGVVQPIISENLSNDDTMNSKDEKRKIDSTADVNETSKNSETPSDNTDESRKPPVCRKSLSSADKLKAAEEELNALEKRVESFTGGKSEREFIVIDEMLTKVLLSLDGVESNGNEEIRRARRELVRRAQTLVGRLEKKGSVPAGKELREEDKVCKEQTGKELREEDKAGDEESMETNEDTEKDEEESCESREEESSSEQQ